MRAFYLQYTQKCSLMPGQREASACWAGLASTPQYVLVFGLKAKLPHRAFCKVQMGGLLSQAVRAHLCEAQHLLKICLAALCWPLDKS